jgi:hypothetical protein
MSGVKPRYTRAMTDGSVSIRFVAATGRSPPALTGFYPTLSGLLNQRMTESQNP